MVKQKETPANTSWGIVDTGSKLFFDIPKAFSNEELDIIHICGTKKNLSTELKYSQVDKGTISPQRQSYNSWIKSDEPKNFWLFQKLHDIILTANNNMFKFDLQMIEALQYTKYPSSKQSNGKYSKHIDMLTDSIGQRYLRKLSFSLQLSDPKTYTGGNLNIYYQEDPIVASRERGSITFFPSWALHEVTPVTQGTRYSLVGWVLGPKFK